MANRSGPGSPYREAKSARKVKVSGRVCNLLRRTRLTNDNFNGARRLSTSTIEQHRQAPGVQARESRAFKTIITVLFLGIGGPLFWYGCTGLPAGSDILEMTTPSITTTFTPTSTATAPPTVTLTLTPTRTPSPTLTATADLRVLNPANQHLYLYVKESKTWHAARDYCAERGGHLVTIQVPSENKFVYDLATDNVQTGTWLGATDEAQEGKWSWVTGEPWNYWNWDKNRILPQPDDQSGNRIPGADFLIFDYWDRTWHDVPNQEFPYFVCEWEPASP